jgi:uncharacterized membrane protein YuzA (DUF378 family)
MQIASTSAASTSVFTTLDWVAWVLVIVGAVNWGLVGLLSFDLVAAIFGSMTAASRIVYVLVGIAGLYFLSYPFRRRL